MLYLGRNMHALRNILYTFILGILLLFKIFIPLFLMALKYNVWF
jgi:hypothetical protein